MTDPRQMVIAGGGIAAAHTARALRAEGFTGRVTILGDEPEPPYARIALSKDHLLGRSELRVLRALPPGWYADNDVDLRTGTRVTGIDRAARSVTAQSPDGGAQTVVYDRLLLATGARARVPDVRGIDARAVLTLRTITDCHRLRVHLSPGARVVIIGSGWLGLEVASAAAESGAQVTVLARSHEPLVGLLGERIGALYRRARERAGGEVRIGAQVGAITTRGGRARAVELTDGTVIPADVVVAAIGARPNSEIAAATGLAIDRRGAVEVDEHLQTADPAVLAAGDVAAAWHPVLGRRLHIEHGANALNQPVVAAQTMLDIPAVYDRLPYFFSDQFGLDMEFSGLVDDPDAGGGPVIRGDIATGRFLAFWLRGDVVIAGMNMNIWDRTGQIQDLIR